MKYEKAIRWFVICIILCLLAYCVRNTKKLNGYRDICDKYRKQLTIAEERNREFENRFVRITETTGRISETANANITNARDIIETVEKLRMEIQDLENICYGGNTLDSYYDWLDSKLGLQ